MHRTETTNGKLADVMAEVQILIGWAEADAEHAEETDAPGIAADDRYRVSMLRGALKLLEECTR
jgi:NTP pyrophosphatase (non-canonical NTP hydrolase)